MIRRSRFGWPSIATPIRSHASRRAPPEVVGCGNVDEHVEAALVAKEGTGLDEPCRVDHDRRLAKCLVFSDQAGDATEGHSAPPSEAMGPLRVHFATPPTS